MAELLLFSAGLLQAILASGLLWVWYKIRNLYVETNGLTNRMASIALAGFHYVAQAGISAIVLALHRNGTIELIIHFWQLIAIIHLFAVLILALIEFTNDRNNQERFTSFDRSGGQSPAHGPDQASPANGPGQKDQAE